MGWLDQTCPKIGWKKGWYFALYHGSRNTIISKTRLSSDFGGAYDFITVILYLHAYVDIYTVPYVYICRCNDKFTCMKHLYNHIRTKPVESRQCHGNSQWPPFSRCSSKEAAQNLALRLSSPQNKGGEMFILAKQGLLMMTRRRRICEW